MGVGVALERDGGRAFHGKVFCALESALRVCAAAFMLLLFTIPASMAQGTGGGGGGSANPVTVACNGQPESLKLCKPGNRACLTAELEPVIRAASPAGVAATPNNQITFTGIPANGATIEYRISVPNIGTVGTFVQNSPSTGTIDTSATTFSVPIGGSQTFTFNNITGPTFDQAIEIDRQASGFAIASYTVKCTPKPTKGKITIIKNSVGGAASFSIQVAGPGGTTAVPITASGSPNGTGSTSLTLNPGNYTISETPPAGWGLTGIACVNASGTGTASGGSVNLDAGDETTCTITNTKQIAGLSFTKTATTASFSAAGQPVAFALRIENTGTAPFTNISVSDPGTALSSGCSVSSLTPGQVATCTATHTSTQADLNAGKYDNTAILTGTLPDATTSTAAAKATVQADVNGALTLEQTASPETYSDVGQTLTYTLVVRNTSPVALQNVNLSLTKATLISCKPHALPGVLPPGSTTTCTARYVTTNDDIDGKCKSNPATVSGSRAGQTVRDTADAKVCMTPEKTVSAIRNFIARRVDLLAANQPDSLHAIRRFRSRSSPGGNPADMAGNIEDGNGNVSFKTSLSQMLAARRSPQSSGVNDEDRMGLGARTDEGPATTRASSPLDIWVEANYLRWRDGDDELGRSGDLAIAYIGADVTVAPGILLGALVQTDFMTDHTDATNVNINGNGWMAGPYAAVQFSENLYFDARAAYGRSDNAISPFGSYTDHFETERWLARANLTGSWSLGALRFSPSVGLIYADETQAAYTDTLGQDIASQSARIGRLTFGPEIAYSIPLGDGGTLEPHVAMTGMWDFTSRGSTEIDGAVSGKDGLRARVEAGVLYHGPEGASLRAAATYDGIGSSDVSSWGGQLSVNVPLEQIASLIEEETNRRSAIGSIAYAGAADAKPAVEGAPPPADGASNAPADAPAEYELPAIVVKQAPEEAPVRSAPKKVVKPAPVEEDEEPPPPKKQAQLKPTKPSTTKKGGGGSPGKGTGGGDGDGSSSSSGGGEGTSAASSGVADAADSIPASGGPRRIVEQVGSIQEISAKEIEQRGARSLDEAIELATGLHVRNAPDGVPRIDIRGLRTRNITLLVDGVPVNSTFDGQFDPKAIPVENIARIKVVKGGSSVLYGPGGNAGVIDIITKGASKGLHGTAQAQWSPERGTDERITSSYGSDKFRIFMSASMLNQDSFRLSDDFVPTHIQGAGERINSDRKDQALYTNMMWTPTSAASFGMSVNYRKGEYGKPPSTLTRDESIFAQRERHERVDDFDALSVTSSGMIKLSPHFFIRPLAYYNRSNELTNSYDDDTFSTQIHANARHESAITENGGGGAQAIFKQGESQLTVAVDGRNESFELSGFQVNCAITAPDGSCTLDGKTDQLAFDHDVQIFSASAEQELKFTEQLSAVLGAGYSQQRKLAVSDDGYTYLAGMRYALTDTTAVRGSIARKIRFPTLRDLYDDQQGGNDKLKTEVTQNYDAAIEQKFLGQNLAVEIGVFRIDAEDFIQRVDSQLKNIAVLQLQGVETSATWRGIPGLEVTAGHTFLDAQNLSPGATTRELQYRPEHKLSLNASYKFDTGTTISADYLYVAGSKALPGGDNGGGPVIVGPTPVLPLGSYHVLNAGITQTIPGTAAELFGRIDNVLDEDYVETFSQPQPGRSFFIGARAKF